MRRFFLLLSFLNCTILINSAADISEQNHTLWESALSTNVRGVELKEESTPSRSIEVSRRSLTSTRLAFLASRTITSRDEKSRRRKRRAARDDRDRRSRKIGRVNGGVSSSLSHERQAKKRPTKLMTMTPLRRRKSHRGRHRCKNRLGCSHSAKKSGRVDTRAKKSAKKSAKRSELQSQYLPINRHLEGQLLVGNRSLALFRQELAAAAAKLAETGKKSRKLGEISDILADGKPRHPAAFPKISLPEITSKIRAKPISNGSIGEETIELGREKIGKGSSTSTRIKAAINKPNVTIHEASLIVNGSRNFLEDEQNENKNEFANDTDYSRRREIETAPIVKFEESDDDFPGRTIFASIFVPIDEDRRILHESFVPRSENSTNMAENRQLPRDSDERGNSLGGNNDADVDENLCQKWIDSKNKLEQAFLGSLVQLPACPCQYPSSIFNDDKLWDELRKKHFRWRDVSGDSARIGDYKPGATYCVRSLLAKGSGHAAAQNCCYDRQRRLLTRGPDAGTPNFASSEISSKFHGRVDISPWRLCKGDFTRFNKVRTPNNDNHCEVNPKDEKYQRQIENTKYYR